MLSNHLQERITFHLGEEPTKGQHQLIEMLSTFVAFPENRSAFVLKGYAGTGKTSIIASFVKTLKENNQPFVLLAPTGRAAKVISTYSGFEAFTIHKKIYRQKNQKEGFGEFSLNFNPHKDTLFIVDEASMVSESQGESRMFGSGNLLNDLIQFVYNERNCRLILIGDVAQLPPVGTLNSPALDTKSLQSYGLRVSIVELTEVVRQTANSGILNNATLIRSCIEKVDGYPQLQTEGYTDFVRLSGTDLIEQLNESYEKMGIEQTVVVCRSNKRAIRYNQGVRQSIFWYEEALSRDDYLMVVRNNYFWLPEPEKDGFIANGDIVKVLRLKKYQDRYDFHFVLADLQFVDFDLEIEAWLLLDTLTTEFPALSAEDNKRLYYAVAEDYKHITNSKKRMEALKADPFFNALQVKFAYAVTCHKAQGGQWKHVYVDQGYLVDDMLNAEYMRWLYTSFTRATEKVFLVNFNGEFFGEKKEEK